MPDTQRKWRLGALVFDLEEREDGWWLRQQTPDGNLLSTLADIGYPVIARCALDILMAQFLDPSFWMNTTDDFDALEAYSGRPLQPVPTQYMELFYALDVPNNPTKQMSAIVLAGCPGKQEQELLLSLIRTCPGDMRDGPLYAASSYNDMRFIKAVAEVVMATSEAGLGATGEMVAITICFRRWIQREFITAEEVERLLQEYEDIGSGNISARRMMNFIECPMWKYVPYPEERETGL